jgi:hypothetical protein
MQQTAAKALKLARSSPQLEDFRRTYILRIPFTFHPVTSLKLFDL